MLTRIYGTIAALGAVILAALTFVFAKKREFRKEGAQEVSRRATIAANARKDTRDEINDTVTGGGAADRLRDKWSRD